MHYIIIVPAVFKEPDIHIYDDSGEKEFAVIDNEQPYTAEWNYEQLNKDQFKENGTISFTLENWFFFLSSRWNQRTSVQKKFVILNDYNNGTVQFMQGTNRFAKFQFDISVIVLVKQTKNLKIMYTSSVLSFAHKLFEKDITRESAIVEYCNIWVGESNENVSNSDLEACPCTINAVRFDPDFISDPTCSSTSRECHENIDAFQCYLKIINNTM